MQKHHLTSPSPARTGITLVEVLMSMMIMVIGVSFVMSLFPIAAVRTAQATKMTNAAILKYNVETIIERQPHYVFDPDGDYTFLSATLANLTEHTETVTERNYIVDPNGYFAHATTGFSYVSDPSDPDAARGFCDFFGSQDLDDNEATPPTALDVLPRFDAGVRTGFASTLDITDATEALILQEQAAKLVSLGDGADVIIDDFVEGFILANGNFAAAPANTDTVVGVRLSTEVSLVGVPSSTADTSSYPADAAPDPELTRITIFSQDDTFSQTFVLTTISGQDCLITEDFDFDGDTAPETGEDLNLNGITDLRSLAPEFINSSNQYAAGRVVIERTRSNDFNWMLTVRRELDGRATGVDVVIRFNNGVSVDDERVFKTVAGGGFNRNSFSIRIVTQSGLDGNGDPMEPFLRRGGYALDVDNARWYRISDFEVLDDTQTEVTFETTPVENTPNDAIGNVIFLPGIVDVFPLGSVPYPNDYPAISRF